MLEAHEFILFTQLVEVEVKLASEHILSEYSDSRGVDWYLSLEYTYNVVDSVQAGHRAQTHKMCDVQQSVRLKVFELRVHCEQLSELEQVSGQDTLLT